MLGVTSVVPHASVAQQRAPAPREVQLPYVGTLDADAEDAAADDSLARAIADAYESNPLLAAKRYELRATDDQLGTALAQTRATIRGEISAGYRFTRPGDTTQAGRPLVDRLNSPNIRDNDVATQIVVDQPLSTGGRAAAAIAAARGDIRAGRESLRGTEGDLLYEVIAAYADIRRDRTVLAIRQRNEAALVTTLDEVKARREAGELTLTDVAQADTQLQAARAERNFAEAELENSRSAFIALVGREPGVLAPAPALPNLPRSSDEAFTIAAEANPDLANAVETERASRSRIAAARAERNPSIMLRGSAGSTGQLAPFRRDDQDLYWSGRVVVTIPFTSGGRTNAGIAQALDRNSADRLRIEATRRRMVQQIGSAWNQMATAQRNAGVQQERLRAAQTYYEGTFEEYREGLRSTFDVLYAESSLREAEVALLGSRRDQYVASAALLRQIGGLEVAKLLTGTGLYDPSAHVRRVEKRALQPLDQLFRAIDRVDMPGQTQQRVEGPERLPGEPRVAPAAPAAGAPDLIRQFPVTPIPGTSALTAKRTSP